MRRIIVASEAQAQADGSAAVEPHHLLLATTVVPGPTAWALATNGLDEARLRHALGRRSGVPLPATDRRVPLTADRSLPTVPFSRRSVRGLKTAGELARRRGHREITGEDLALVLVSSEVPEIVAALDDLGLAPETLRGALGLPPT